MNVIDRNEYNPKEIIENKNFINIKKKVEVKVIELYISIRKQIWTKNFSKFVLKQSLSGLKSS